jgi:hypothetical protein
MTMTESIFNSNFEKLKRFIFILIASFFIGHQANAQYDSTLVQLSGLVMTADSLKSLPQMLLKNARRKVVAISDFEGFFSVVVKEGDTIYFSQIGYRTTSYIVPKNLQENRYSIVQLMVNDTINLPATTIRPWPTRQKFAYEFVHGNFEDDQLETARKNIEKENLDQISINMSMDGAENYRSYMNKQYQQYYWSGQSPPMRLLDPIAWSQFFNAWKEGKFKKKK